MTSVPSATVNNLGALQRFLKSLGSPPAGFVRVYRGQTRAYTTAFDRSPLLLPAGARDGYKRAWDPGYERLVFTYVADYGFYEDRGDWKNAIVWMPALLQHYGHGSFFLDVSSDLLISLWFSIHQYTEQSIDLPVMAGNQYTINRRIRMASYVAISNDVKEYSPVLYVLDVPRWNGRGALSRGQLVDLLALREGQALAPLASRLRVQSASLIYAFDPVHDRRNLADAVRAIVSLEPEFVSDPPPELKRRTLEIFPAPADDRLYKVLLNIPQRLCTGPVRVEHPLSIQMFIDGGSVHQSHEPANIISPVLFYQAVFSLLGTSRLKDFSGTVPHGHDIRNAVPVLLETSFLSNMPGTNLDGWIESTLPFGIADRLADRATSSIYIEFSSLDVYQDALQGHGIILRGVWVIREHPHYIITLFGQDNLQQPELAAAEFEYDGVRGKFEITKLRPWSIDRPVDEISRRCLFSALTLLRDLSPGYKPPALYGISVEGFMSVRSIFEPQMAFATVERVGDIAYLVPHERDGGIYRGLRFEFDAAAEEWDEGAIMTELDQYFKYVRESYYSWYLGEALCAFHLDQGRFQRMIEIANASINAIGGCGFPGMDTELQCMRAWALFYSGETRAACQSLVKAWHELQSQAKGRDMPKEKAARIMQIYAALGCSGITGDVIGRE
jgi:FRG domain-containing protein